MRELRGIHYYFIIIFSFILIFVLDTKKCFADNAYSAKTTNKSSHKLNTEEKLSDQTTGTLNEKNKYDAEMLKYRDLIDKNQKYIPEKFDSRNYSAVILKREFDYEIKTEVNEQGTQSKNNITYEVYSHEVHYIQTAAGNSIGDFNREYDSEVERFEILEARVIKPSGKYYRIPKNNIFDTQHDANSHVVNYRYIRVQKFSMTNIEKGDLIEYRTKLTSWRKMAGSGFGDFFYFSDEQFPIINENLCYNTENQINLNYKLIDKNNLIIKNINANESYNSYCFSVENIKPEIKQNNAPAGFHYGPYIYLSTWNDWNYLAKWMFNKYEKLYEPDDKMRRLVSEITKDKTGEEGIKAIFYWIQKNIRYVQTYLTQYAGFVPDSATQILTDGFGDCKEKTTLFIAMLRIYNDNTHKFNAHAINIKAYPILVSTKDVANADLSFPMMYWFNHMITYIEFGDKIIILDPVYDSYSYPDLIPMDQGRNCMVLKKDEFLKLETPNHIPFMKPEDSATIVYSKLDLNLELLKWNFDSTYTLTGEEASIWRHRLMNNSYEKVIEIIKHDWAIKNTVYTYPTPEELSLMRDDFDKPISINITGENNDRVYNNINEKQNSALLFLPNTLKVPYMDEIINYYDRIYPYIWMYNKFITDYTYEFQLPPNYAIVEPLPWLGMDEIDERNAIFEYKVSCNIDYIQNKIILNEVFTLKKPTLDPDDFRNIRKNVEHISQKLNKFIMISTKLE
jgi:hypothetical protein